MGYSSSDPDLQSWTANVALELPDEFHRRGCRVFNTDVHPGAGAANGGGTALDVTLGLHGAFY